MMESQSGRRLQNEAKAPVSENPRNFFVRWDETSKWNILAEVDQALPERVRVKRTSMPVV